jgi:hypothetical protein
LRHHGPLKPPSKSAVFFISGSGISKSPQGVNLESHFGSAPVVASRAINTDQKRGKLSAANPHVKAMSALATKEERIHYVSRPSQICSLCLRNQLIRHSVFDFH